VIGDYSPEAQWRGSIRSQLFERRIVVIAGLLDEATTNQAAAELMTLDATGDDPVQLQLDTSDGSVDAALSLMDVIELLGVPVRVTCAGQVGGPGIGVLAVGHHRRALPSTRFHLFEPRGSFVGDARQLEHWAAIRLDQWRVFSERLARATGQSPSTVEHDLARGRFLSAEEAAAYGLLDEIARPDAQIYRLAGRPIGFGPR
jgi:ATP-dependent Clp protease protease subunit